MRIEGVIAPLTAAFTSQGTLALDRLKDNVARYNGTGMTGYVVNGSTGESVLLSREEVERAWAAVREAAAPDKLLIAGTGVDSTAETIERTNRAAALGYQAALVKTPYYYKPVLTPQLQIEHFERVAEAAKIPVLIYSVPQFTGVAVEAAVVERLARHPNIIGIKESSGNLQRIAEIIHRTSREFQTVVGSASTFYPSLVIGARGGILALACALPEPFVEIYKAAEAGDAERARNLQDRLLPAALRIMSELGIPGVKYAMDKSGYYGGPARRPLLPLTDTQKREVETLLAALSPAAAARS